MLKRIMAVSMVVGMAAGLAACDNKQQEQAEQPTSREQAAPTPAPQQGTITPQNKPSEPGSTER